MRVLVVEDEQSLAEALADGLRADGFSTDVAPDGIEAMWRLREFDYDALVLDIMLPKLSGYEVLRQLRGAGIWTPVLMLSAKDGEFDEADALDLGADDYLTKPFSYVVLQAHLRALLRRGARERPAVLTCQDLRLDPATKRCHRGGSEVRLTARECSVLDLLRHRGQVVSKIDLLTHVWDEQFHGDPNVVEVYVLRLRRKLDVGDAEPLVYTVRGAGYYIGQPSTP
jgi:DNA-binding response OmpR family regulator